MKKFVLIGKWVFAFVAAILLVYAGYEVRAWFMSLFKFNVPTKPTKPGQTVIQSQKDYALSKSGGRTGLDAIVNDDLSIWEKGYFYLQTLNPFRRIPDSRK